MVSNYLRTVLHAANEAQKIILWRMRMHFFIAANVAIVMMHFITTRFVTMHFITMGLVTIGFVTM